MKCLNRKVLIGLAVAAVALFFLAPSGRGLLPLMLVAVCPLSMVFMMRGMSKMGSSAGSCPTNQADPQQDIERKDAEIARLSAMLDNGKRAERS